jgi:hypothetical protein
MLEHLVRVDDVERAVGELQRVDVRHREVHIVQLPVGDRPPGLRQHLFACVRRGHPAGLHPFGQIRRNGAGAAADVQQRGAGAQVREQVGGGVLGGAPGVGAQHAGVEAVGVDGI